MHEESFNPSRLELARNRRGITWVALAERSAVGRERLHRFLKGTEQPNSSELESIARVLAFPPDFFFRADIELPSDGHFRAMSAMTAGERNAALASAALAFEISKWIDERYHLPEADLPNLSLDYKPEEAAIALRNYWGIGERPISNMVHLLESKGVRVFSLTERTRRVDAYSLWFQNVPFAFLNTMKTPEKSRTDAAHELGHLVMHRDGIQKGRDIEREAQAFAGAFLVPRQSAIANMGPLNVPSLPLLVKKKYIWKVSVGLLAHRLHEIGMLSDYYYRGICIELNRYGRSREPNGIERETSHVLKSVFGDLQQAGMTKADVAQDLALYTEEIDNLIFNLGGVVAVSGKRKDDDEADEQRNKLRVV